MSSNLVNSFNRTYDINLLKNDNYISKKDLKDFKPIKESHLELVIDALQPINRGGLYFGNDNKPIRSSIVQSPIFDRKYFGLDFDSKKTKQYIDNQENLEKTKPPYVPSDGVYMG